MKYAILATMLVVMKVSAETTIDGGAFTNFADALTTWVQGSLGYVIALLGTLGSILWYIIGENIVGHGGLKSLFVGILVSFFAGGMVNIVQIMMRIGDGTFK